MELTLECKTRPAGSKPNALRRSGLIPASLYGHKGAESVSLVVEAKAAEILLRKASINNTLINVSIPDLPWNGKALLREVQTHPWRRFLYHISFFSVSEQATLDVNVPVHTVGEAPGVKNEGGSLDLEMSEVHVRCAPDLIPQAIEIDISSLNMGDAIHLRDLVLPAGVAAMDDADRVVVAVLPPQSGRDTGTAAAE
jgi:large subunit ribosomal protein L25